MLIYIIHGDYIYTYRLPKDIGGNYMLNDIDVNGRTRSLVNISGEENKWFFNANDEVSVFYNGSYSNIPDVEYLKADQIYHFTYDGTYWVVDLNHNTDTTYTFDGTYNASTNPAATVSTVTNAIGNAIGGSY